jgi:Transglutaminase-like superfamily
MRVLHALPVMLAACAAHAQDVHWYTLAVDGVRTGFVRSERTAAADTIVESETVTLFVRELGRTARVRRDIVFRHDSAGNALGFDYELNAGMAREAWRGTFQHGGLRIHPTTTHAADVSLELPAEVSFTQDRSALFEVLWRGQQTSVDVVAFDPQRRSAGLLRARVVGDDDTGRHVHIATGADADADASGEDIWFDANGNLVRAEEPSSFHALLTWTPCVRDCDSAVDAPLDFMGRLVVRSPVRIPGWFKHRTLRYVISRSDGALPVVAQTFEQAVAFDATHAVVTICTDCGSEAPPSEQTLAHYLEPNAWVRSDAPEIRNLALNTVMRGAGVDFRMHKLERLVKQRMRGNNDFLGYADALTALHTGSGDCTEFAVLLAAFARAQGIPTRIAAGLAYSDRFSGRKDVFSPHVWVQVWDGTRWRSYDAALDGFDATHIALAVGSGEPDVVNRTIAQLPLLRIEKSGVVRNR